ncbi:GH15 family glucan-1,4-alpha-glucosidase [Methylopila capsulata]|uniref:GH15 family glucan-1,4-alpha-glucosidase n=1 Tax=Methylopila capsulata TaxID=61654 RepID=A0A9W6IUR8_9HYPH|nr:glycoside hydrolase family 15 protein [Methylopila capsulata]MBM7850252.1 GH15 family glucan-1,4-alpha-glucosidase [Methylopila capsulata]GLK55545.1 glucoamylase [Methylopila capsulata]
MTVPNGRASLELGVVGNAAAAALIDRRARLVWMCFPRFDGDPTFCGLLAGDDADKGFWDFQLEGLTRVEQEYHRNTAILETRLFGRDGAIRVVDFAPRFRRSGRMFRPNMIVRRVEPISGSPRIAVRMRPCRDWGAAAPDTTRGSNHIRFLLGDSVLRLTTDAPVAFVADETPFVLDRPLAFLLGPDESLTDSPARISREFYERTRDYWIDWTRYLSLPFEWQEIVIRAAITLKLCSHEETGGIVAALTTSIPEYGDTGRTWDYRFCWLRDSYFTVEALNRLGATNTMEGYLSYVTNLVAGSPNGYLQPLFGLGFETTLDESQAESLPGYQGFGPVRKGNAAYTQVQNDGYGSVILAVAQCFFDARLPTPGDEALFERLEKLGRQAVERWDQPDAGIWEYRTREGVHTHSSAMCWAACDRLSRIADRLGLSEKAGEWGGRAAELKTDILQRAWNVEMKSFTSVFGGDTVDASLLLLPEIGIVAPHDPRFLGTLAEVERQLRYGNHIYRYKAPDDFGEPETAFTACTFWLINALAAVGRMDEARAAFQEVLDHCNHLGLLSEGLHVGTGELWGNFPQTYSMVGVVKAAMRLSRPWEDAF